MKEILGVKMNKVSEILSNSMLATYCLVQAAKLRCSHLKLHSKDAHFWQHFDFHHLLRRFFTNDPATSSLRNLHTSSY